MSELEPRYRAVVMGASLGGIEALQHILGAITLDLRVPVLIAQHLAPAPGQQTDRVLGRGSRLRVGWAVDGAPAAPGRVALGPPRSDVLLQPDGTLTVRAHGRPTSFGQVDHLFASAAEAFGPGVLAILLTGKAHDGREGARAVKAAGGTVVAQDQRTSAEFSMPFSAIAAGLADLVLPLNEIPGLLDDVVGRGRRLPLPAVLAAERMLAVGGEMGRLVAGRDWSLSPLGSFERWPESLRAALGMALGNGLPMNVAWGSSMVQLYNDAYQELIGDRHPGALGRRLLKDHPDLEPLLQPVWDGVAATSADRSDAFSRDECVQERFVTLSFSPLRDGSAVAGVLVTAIETTEHVRGARRQRTLHALANVSVDAGEDAGCEQAAAVLAADPEDVPFALVYRAGATGAQAELVAAAGVEAGSAAAPRTMTIGPNAVWPLDRGGHTQVDHLHERFPELPAPTALVLAAGRLGAGDDGAPVMLVLGVSARAPLDAGYRAFLELVAEQVGATVLAARVRRAAADRQA